jgi:hypothetical protein
MGRRRPETESDRATSGRRLRVSYVVSGAQEWAAIETRRGWYVCDVYRCSDEGRMRFRQRVRALQYALQAYPDPLLTTSPEEA